jgi:hypothetical protein
MRHQPAPSRKGRPQAASTPPHPPRPPPARNNPPPTRGGGGVLALPGGCRCGEGRSCAAWGLLSRMGLAVPHGGHPRGEW